MSSEHAFGHAEAGISRRRFLTGLGVGRHRGGRRGLRAHGLARRASPSSTASGTDDDPRPALSGARRPHARRRRARRRERRVEHRRPVRRPRVSRRCDRRSVSRMRSRSTTRSACAPELASLAARYHDGHVAIVEGIGYPDPDLSHFASLAYWWSGAPGVSGTRGLARPLPRRHRRLRRPARRGRHRAGAVARAAREPFVRDFDRRCHRPPTQLPVVGRRTRRSRRRVVALRTRRHRSHDRDGCDRAGHPLDCARPT